MTITELCIQLDLQPESKIDILEDVATKYNKRNKGYLFVDSSDGYCYLFDEDGNEDDIKKLTKIYSAAFYRCKSLKSIAIPDSVERIGDDVFAYCKSLESIIIPDSVKSIGDFAFWNCESLKSIEIPDSVERIGNGIFSYCESLKSIIISDSIERIGIDAFWGCENLKSIIFKGKTIDQVKEMKHYPFGIKNESIIKCI